MRRLHYLKSQLAEQNGAISVKQAEYDALDNDYNKAEERMSAIEDKIRETEISVEKHGNTLKVKIPCNTRATVIFGGSKTEIGSGSYTFEK